MNEPTPSVAACGTCRFSVSETLPPPNLSRVLICKLLPPAPVLVPTQGGMQQMALRPIVHPKDFCFQYQDNPDAPPNEDKKIGIING